MKNTKKVLVGSAGLLALITCSALATTGGQMSLTAARQILSAVPAPEIPDKAASLISQAKIAEQEQVAITIVSAATDLAPALAAEIVALVSRRAPATAAESAAAAALLQPKAAPTIARVAAAAVPSRAGDIVAAVCKKLPAQYKEITLEVAAAVPDATQSILAGLARAIPALKPLIDRATYFAVVNGSSAPTVTVIMPLVSNYVKRAAERFSLTTEHILQAGLTPGQQEELTLDLASTLRAASLDESANPPREGKKPGQTNHGRGHAYGHSKNYSQP